MVNSNFSSLMLALSLILLVGCDDAKETIQNIEEQNEISEGRFLSECSSVGIEGLTGFSKKDELRFAGNQVAITTTTFEGTDCNSQNTIGNTRYSGEFTVKQKKEGDNVDQGLIQFELDEVKLTPESEIYANALNTINYCGENSYEKNKTTDLSQNSESLTCFLKNVPSTLAGVYYYDKTNDILTLSDDPSDMTDVEDLNFEDDNTDSKEQDSKQILPLIQVFADVYYKQ